MSNKARKYTQWQQIRFCFSVYVNAGRHNIQSTFLMLTVWKPPISIPLDITVQFSHLREVTSPVLSKTEHDIVQKRLDLLQGSLLFCCKWLECTKHYCQYNSLLFLKNYSQQETWQINKNKANLTAPWGQHFYFPLYSIHLHSSLVVDTISVCFNKLEGCFHFNTGNYRF